MHDDPLNDLTQRPEVTIRVIPGVLREPGAGFFGTVYPSKLSKIDYEFYVTQGMNGFSSDGTPRITNASGLASARWQTTDIAANLDNNMGQAFVGRVAYSPILGVDLAFLGIIQKSTLILNVRSTLGPSTGPTSGGLGVPRRGSDVLDGGQRQGSGRPVHGKSRTDVWLVWQLNYHFMPSFVRNLAPSYFTHDSISTGVFRIDDVNTNLDSPGSEGDTFDSHRG